MSTMTRPRTTLPFLTEVVDATKRPIDVARTLKRRADTLKIRLNPGIYFNHESGAACLIGTLATDLVKQLNGLDLDNGELMEWTHAVVHQRTFENKWYAEVLCIEEDTVLEALVPQTTGGQSDLYEFIMDATEQVDFEILGQLERGFESNTIQPELFDNNLYWELIERFQDREGYRLSTAENDWLFDDRPPSKMRPDQRRAWDRENYAFKVGYYLRLMAKGIIS